VAGDAGAAVGERVDAQLELGAGGRPVGAIIDDRYRASRFSIASMTDLRAWWRRS
jgi:hypothetical protein